MPMRRLLTCILACALASSFAPLAIHSSSSGTAPNDLMTVMLREVNRASTSLTKSDPAAYFLSYAVSDVDGATIVASNGALIFSSGDTVRHGDVIMRVGSVALDNTHNQSRPSGIISGALPLDNDADATARLLWHLTNREYEQASAAFSKVKANNVVQAAEDDKSPDFSQESPQKHADLAPFRPFQGQKTWEERMRKLSASFLNNPEVYSSSAILTVSSDRSYLATSEGTSLIRPSSVARLVVQAETRADDGSELMRVESFQAATPEQLPSDAEIAPKVEKMSVDLTNLRAAPVAEPYAGPAMLSGRAAAVFFHEVLGHRLEGHRQRDETQGQTFTKKVNQLVLPAFLSVTDDPTLKELGGVKLAGTYDYDDEGVPAERVIAVENGVLKNFLMSRMPINNFSHSNGHGRRQPGLMATGRQGNLIVTSTHTEKDAELKRQFVEEIKKQGKTYGLYFDDIQGGFTLTGRATPQSVLVKPVMVYRVYADGRSDELVRGVEIVSTPLVALNNIMVTGDTMHVFNGICGAESGQVPVSAAAPAMLFSEIEVQKAKQGTERPPILPPPSTDAPGKPDKTTQRATPKAKP